MEDPSLSAGDELLSSPKGQGTYAYISPDEGGRATSQRTETALHTVEFDKTQVTDIAAKHIVKCHDTDRNVLALVNGLCKARA